MSSKSKYPSALSWTKIALCATVFLPSFANATNAAPQPDDQQILDSFLQPDSPAYLKQREIYRALSPEDLEKQIVELEKLGTKAQKFLDRGDKLPDVYAVLQDVHVAPEVTEQAQQVILCQALLSLAQSVLRSKNQPFSPRSPEHSSNHEL